MGLVDTVRDAARTAADATRRGAGAARDRATGMSLRRRLNGQAEELGHVVVRQRDGEAGLDAEIDRLVSEIRATRAEIAALEED